MRPNPHPLDYDWRFSNECVTKALNLLPTEGKIFSIGTPSLAFGIRSRGQHITIVDRQELPEGIDHLQLDANVMAEIRENFDCSIIDPPWYPEETVRWVSLGAASIKKHGQIFLSIWPDETRPNAIMDKKEFLKWVKGWGDYDIIEGFFNYETPKFEKEALKAKQIDLKPSFRKGDLLKITKNSTPDVPLPIIKKHLWHRFVIGEYQLALRVNECEEIPSIHKHPKANGWIWTSVSKRAIGRDQISLWDSNNKVAIVNGSNMILGELRRMLGLATDGNSEAGAHEVLSKVLKEWEVPSVGPGRVREWHHLD